MKYSNITYLAEFIPKPANAILENCRAIRQGTKGLGA